MFSEKFCPVDILRQILFDRYFLQIFVRLLFFANFWCFSVNFVQSMFSEKFCQSIFPTKFSDQYFLPIFGPIAMALLIFMFFGKFRPVDVFRKSLSSQYFPTNFFRSIFFNNLTSRYFFSKFLSQSIFFYNFFRSQPNLVKTPPTPVGVGSG